MWERHKFVTLLISCSHNIKCFLTVSSTHFWTGTSKVLHWHQYALIWTLNFSAEGLLFFFIISEMFLHLDLSPPGVNLINLEWPTCLNKVSELTVHIRVETQLWGQRLGCIRAEIWGRLDPRAVHLPEPSSKRKKRFSVKDMTKNLNVTLAWPQRTLHGYRKFQKVNHCCSTLGFMMECPDRSPSPH